MFFLAIKGEIQYDTDRKTDSEAGVRGNGSKTAENLAHRFDCSRLACGVDAYYDGSGMLRCVIVYRGTAGIGEGDDVYSRTYYYDNGKPIFAFYEGDDAHRFYFREEQLMRWRYQAATVSNDQAVNYDFDTSAEYRQWEQTVLAESAKYS